MFKHLTALALVLCTALSLPAYASKAPFSRELKERFQILENESRVLKLPYSFTDEPAAASDTIPLGVAIPSDYLITKSWVYVDQDVTSLHSNTVAVGCETTNDLLAAHDFAPANEHAIAAGAVTGVTNAVRTDGCTPTLTIGAGASGITAGRLIFNFEIQKVENLLDESKIDLEP